METALIQTMIAPDLKNPNAKTIEAIQEIERGNVDKFKSAKEMFESIMDDAENS